MDKESTNGIQRVCQITGDVMAGKFPSKWLLTKRGIDYVQLLNIAERMIVTGHTKIPTNLKGRRRLHCEHYGECLDIAVEKKWRYWSCASFCKYNL